MPVNTENIQKAFDNFEDDNFVGAKEILKKEIGAARDTFVRDKIGLEGKKTETEPDKTEKVEGEGDE